jgi:hypothetical protein
MSFPTIFRLSPKPLAAMLDPRAAARRTRHLKRLRTKLNDPKALATPKRQIHLP